MIYFDNSATTYFKPEPVINAVCNTMKFLSANPGRSGHSMSQKAGMLVYKTREKMAGFIDCPANGNIIFTLNCTAALNNAILGTVKKSGNVITTAYEHNSVLRPLFELQRKGLISVTVLEPNPDGVVTADMIAKALKPNTYLVATNHVSNVTGAKTDVKEIGKLARQHDILYLVDAAQSIGYDIFSMNNNLIDMVAVAPHKGLHGPQGIGVLALSERVKIFPVIFGGTGTSSESLYQPLELPEALESGTLPTPAIAGLNAAISWSKKNIKETKEKIGVLTAYLYDNIKLIDNITVYTKKNFLNGIVSFNINTLSSVETSEILSEQYDICVRGGLHCAPLIHKHLGTLDKGMVRVSLGIENTFLEITDLLNALREIAKSG